jgi:nuclear pore complex protein Nup155
MKGTLNGRIFVGGDNGKLSELEFCNESSLFGKIMGDKPRKMKKIDHQEGNLLSRIIPKFLKFSDERMICDVSIDESRHILYSFSEERP